MGINNVTVRSVATADDVKALYEWADIVIVSLKPNLHASGITVILESIILGVPVVCTDSGGLRAYFSSWEICYVPVYAPIAMRVAVEELAADETTLGYGDQSAEALAERKSNHQGLCGTSSAVK